MTVNTAKPSVFDAGLPTLSYDVTDTPQEIYPQFRAAQQQAPIALGPIGPEVLSYDLARTVLRDPQVRGSDRVSICPRTASRRVRCGTGLPAAS